MEWRLYECSSCEESDPYKFVQPVQKDAHPDRACDLDNCPRCDSYLPFTDMGVGEIVVTQRTKGYGDIEVKP